jgi:hypothetical protein
MTYDKIVPFNIYNRCYYWLGYNLPCDLNLAVGLLGDIDLEVLKLACKKVILKTPVLTTNIKDYLIFLKRKDACISSDFNINSYFTVSDRRLENPGGIDSIPDKNTTDFLNSRINLNNELPVKFFFTKGLEKEDCFFILKLSQTVSDIKGGYIIVSKIFQEYNTLTQTPNKIALPSDPPSYSMNNLRSSKNETGNDNTERLRVSFFRDNNSFTGSFNKITFIFEKDCFSKIINFLKKTSYSLDDILFTALALSSGEILNEKGGLERFMRFGSNVDLRESLGIKGGISNFSSFWDILLEKDELKHAKSAIKLVHDKICASFKKSKDIKRAMKISFYKYFPSKLLVKYYASREKLLFKKPFFTSFLSTINNLEEILETPCGCKIKYSWVSSYPHFSFGLNWNVSTHKDKLFATLNFLDPVISEDTAFKLTDYFKKAIEHILEN